jgi:hypothetical protein
VGQVVMGRVVHGASCPWGELSLGRVVRGASCPWGELFLGRVVPWASCPGASCPGASFDGASCPWGELSWGEWSGNQIRQSPQSAMDCQSIEDCHLGRYLTVGIRWIHLVQVEIHYVERLNVEILSVKGQNVQWVGDKVIPIVVRMWRVCWKSLAVKFAQGVSGGY